MMNIFHALILGATQGLTEFLPISSSGHLVIIPYLFKWNYQGMAFDVALHAGTALALVIYFGKDWLVIIKKGLQKKSETVAGEYPSNFLWMIVAACIPAGIIGLALDSFFEKVFHEATFVSLIFIAFNFAFFGWLLWFMDKKAKTNLPPEKLTFSKAILVGFFQSIALIPGVSRSGITIIGSRYIGLNREQAARFSFIIATPIIIGALLVKLSDIFHGDIGWSFLFGVIAAAGFGLLAIKFLLVYLRKSNFSLFMWYRFALAALLIIIAFWRL